MLKHTSICYTLILFSGMVLSLYSIFLDLQSVWADSVIRAIPVGNAPYGIAFNPVNNYTYVLIAIPTPSL